MRHKEFTITNLDENARIDVWFDVEKGKVINFSINLTLIENEKTHDVYRIDTCHGFLHEQKFWISNEKIRLEMDWNHAFHEKLEEIKENYVKWIKLFARSRKNKGSIP